ncbi:alpha/beta hydrolase family protein [Thalassotalea litorea]|uniref:alpha/beta hydrolase family protein n=1 Tax=Thalassotalea litorea TaxID=2020715 RepID=UPI003736D094
MRYLQKLAPRIMAFLVAFSGAIYANATVLPVEAFASKPDVSSVDLSPNGDFIASIVNIGGEHKGAIVNVFNVNTGEESHHLFTDNSKFVLLGLDWANDETLLVTAKFPKRYGTHQVTETRLLQLNVTSGKTNNVIPRALYEKLRYIPQLQAGIVDILPAEKDYILLQLAGMREDVAPSVYKIKLRGKGVGKFKVAQGAKAGVYDWRTDQQHNIRLAIRRIDGNVEVLEQHPQRDGFRVLWKFETLSEDVVWPLGFDVEPNVLFVKAYHQDKLALFKVDLNDKELSKELVYAKENSDVSGALRRDAAGRVIGVGNQYWGVDFADLKKSVNKTLAAYKNYLIDFSADSNRYIVLSSSDVEPGLYYLGDRKARTMEVIGARYNQLDPQLLVQRKKIAYDARDGLKITGYLTLPKGNNGENLPTIVFPHGGPISKETAGFDYWSQFLANRGYAVLQMDFRGSAGYGFDFMSKGLAGWGQAMQDDVEDGARWLIEQNIADPNRICILGASYGGYASLMGVIKSPELYQCAVSFAGVSNLEALVKQKQYFTNYKTVLKQIGDDFEQLWDVSPLKHSKKINVPVLLIHGKRDSRVPFRQSEAMFEQLNDDGKQVTFISLEGGDHNLSNTENRLKTFIEIERFLAVHIGSQFTEHGAGN